MQAFAKRIANHICLHIDTTDEQQEVIIYGTLILWQMIVFIGSVVLLGSLFNILIESLVVCFFVSLLRKYSGGIHAKTMEGCTILGVMICVFLGYLVTLTVNLQPTSLLVLWSCLYVASLILIINLAPVDSPQKPIKTLEKRRKMKKYSLSIWVLAFITSSFFFMLGKITWSMSCCLGMFWQSLTLLPIGKENHTKEVT